MICRVNGAEPKERETGRAVRMLGETRCPRCTALLEADARICNHCELTIAGDEPHVQPVEETVRKTVAPHRPGVVLFCLAWTMAAVAWIFMSVGEAAPVATPGDECRESLRELHEALSDRLDAEDPLPDVKGGAFWRTLAEEEGLFHAAACAAAGDSPYRGPKVPYAKIPEDGIIAADREGVHLDGVRILRKNGEISVVHPGTVTYVKMIADTEE